MGTWSRLKHAIGAAATDPSRVEAALAQAAETQPPPVVWLLGATQAGKTSIIRALTGNTAVEIGNGFRPCTRRSDLYAFPSEAPVLSFLDTRGLGEVAYDPAEDIALCESRAHVLLVVVRVTETRPRAVLEALRGIRKRHPEWPVIIVQTCLHAAYPDDDAHPLPYPFASPDWPQRVPDALRRLLLAQREAFAGLPGAGDIAWVPVDFTLPEDGFEPEHYGAEALWDAIEQAMFLDLRTRVMADPTVADVFARAAHPKVMGYSLAGGVVGGVPVADLVLVPSVQAGMLYALAETYGMSWTRRNTREFFGALGTGFVVTYGGRALGRSLVKLIPVWGQTAGVAWGVLASGAITFGLGKAACYYLARKRDGRAVPAETLREVYREALREGRAVLQAQMTARTAGPGR
ncbi:MAG: hypothetical protein EA371_11800 [Gammaproteobacteria bacterium]|nr:MAG: hypothetical protein EA371_11800 [Gammaproteobacteria bacterium]